MARAAVRVPTDGRLLSGYLWNAGARAERYMPARQRLQQKRVPALARRAVSKTGHPSGPQREPFYSGPSPQTPSQGVSLSACWRFRATSLGERGVLSRLVVARYRVDDVAPCLNAALWHVLWRFQCISGALAFLVLVAHSSQRFLFGFFYFLFISGFNSTNISFPFRRRHAHRHCRQGGWLVESPLMKTIVRAGEAALPSCT